METVFTAHELQRRYDVTELSVFTPKVTLVPADFHSSLNARDMLSSVTDIAPEDKVEELPVPWLGAVMVYSLNVGENLSGAVSGMLMSTGGIKAKPYPEAYYMLRDAAMLDTYNKILCSWCDGILYLVIAQGRTLMLYNSYSAPDFTSAEYFIFNALKKLQLNPEMSPIYFRTPLKYEEEMSLYRYFRSVEQI
ncbi:MAG: DUF3822 family protein [Candidatus Cryptobacteroides sp.]